MEVSMKLACIKNTANGGANSKGGKTNKDSLIMGHKKGFVNENVKNHHPQSFWDIRTDAGREIGGDIRPEGERENICPGRNPLRTHKSL